jgi:hypothetical protein
MRLACWWASPEMQNRARRPLRVELCPVRIKLLGDERRNAMVELSVPIRT